MTQTPPYQVTDPATGEVTETFPFATDAEVEQALAAATGAFDEWRKRPVAERVAIVKRVAELFTERAADLAALITKEMGKRPAQAWSSHLALAMLAASPVAARPKATSIWL